MQKWLCSDSFQTQVMFLHVSENGSRPTENYNISTLENYRSTGLLSPVRNHFMSQFKSPNKCWLIFVQLNTTAQIISQEINILMGERLKELDFCRQIDQKEKGNVYLISKYQKTSPVSYDDENSLDSPVWKWKYVECLFALLLMLPPTGRSHIQLHRQQHLSKYSLVIM